MISFLFELTFYEPQNKKPSGSDTSNVPRPKLGNVLIGGTGIYDCVNDGEIAITFDDGPYLYTNDLLDKFKVSTNSRTLETLLINNSRATARRRHFSSRVTISAKA